MQAPKLAAEEFFRPVQKFNAAVGPLFATLNDKFPLDEHVDHGLSHSLGIFLEHCYTVATRALFELHPDPLPREEWLVATPEVKLVHLRWQDNSKYLKKRYTHFAKKLLHHDPERVHKNVPGDSREW